MHAVVLALLLAQSRSCSELAVASARVVRVDRSGGINRYLIAVTATNRGANQPPNTLQFVDIYKNGEKKDAKGIPPLRTGTSYTFGYAFERSSEAGDGSTQLTFEPDVRSGDNCMSGTDGYRLTF